MFKFIRKQKKVELKDKLQILNNLINEILFEDDKEKIQIDSSTRIDSISFDSIQFLKLILRLEDITSKKTSEILAEIDLTSLVYVKDFAKVLDEN